MKVIGITMVRNEQNVIDHVIRHMLRQDLDLVVVADNLSTDNTRSILNGIKSVRLVVVDDTDPAYRQSEKMTALANEWAVPGDWIVPFDADELWNVRDHSTLSETLRGATTDVLAGYPWVHVPTPGDSMCVGCPFGCMPRRVKTQERWPKAALRWEEGRVIEQGNHWTTSAVPDTLDIRHFQYRSLEHLRRKVRDGAAALELTDLPADSGAHWRQQAMLSDEVLAEQWKRYTNQPLVFDPPTCLACAR